MIDTEPRRVPAWLPVAMVAVLLVLAFVVAERIRRSTPEGKFNRVRLGMSQKRVYELLGPPSVTRGTSDGLRQFEWHWFEHRVRITIWFNKEQQVYEKTLAHYEWMTPYRVAKPMEWHDPP